MRRLPQLKFEVFDRVGHVNPRTIDARGDERLIEQSAGRSMNGLPARSSSSPGCSPTNTTGASAALPRTRSGSPKRGGTGRTASRLRGELIDSAVHPAKLAGRLDCSDPLARRRRHSVQHRLRARGRVGEQRRYERGLRQIAPVPLRHFRAHGGDIGARRIEHGAIIGAPPVLEGIGVGRLRPRRIVRAGELCAIPVHRAGGREDRPAHRGKPADEEKGGTAQNMVLRLEPGDEALTLSGFHPPKANKGVHLVDLAAHRLSHAREPVDQRVRGILQEVPLAVHQTPERFLEQHKALAVAVADDVLGQAHERAWDRERGGEIRQRPCKQLAILAVVPEHGGRRGAGRDQPPRDVAELREIVRARSRRRTRAQAKSESCSGGASSALRSSRSRNARWPVVGRDHERPQLLH
jgi:hypothetical protein